MISIHVVCTRRSGRGRWKPDNRLHYLGREAWKARNAAAWGRSETPGVEVEAKLFVDFESILAWLAKRDLDLADELAGKLFPTREARP